MAMQSARIARERDRALAAEQRSAQEMELTRQVSAVVVDLFKVSDPSEACGNVITAREILDKGAERIRRELNDQPVVQARLMDTMGQVYSSLGVWSRAAPLLEAALAARRRVLGVGHAETAASVHNLAELYYEQGEWARAEMLFREALALRTRLFGQEHEAVAETQNSLAIVVRRRETPEATAEAEALLRTALATRRKLYGPEHAAVASNLGWEIATVNSLIGACLTAARDYRAAEPLLLESHPIIRAAFGDSHNRTRVALRRIADLYEAWGQRDRAAKYRAMLPAAQHEGR